METKDSKKTIWDYVNMISSTKEIPAFDEEFHKVYNPFLVNRSFSLTGEANIVLVNEINKGSITKENHFLFMRSIIPKSRRRNTWPKRKTEEKVKILMEMFECSYPKAKSFADLIPDDKIEEYLKRKDTGGAHILKTEKKR